MSGCLSFMDYDLLFYCLTFVLKDVIVSGYKHHSNGEVHDV